MTDRFRDIASVWNWLPAFRAVAETEHLPTASQMMNVTAPALSRTVKQLEDALGYDLFNREGRGIQLNDRGRRLLLAVRDSMRLIDDSFALNVGEHFAGPIRWTSNWSLSGVTLRALSALIEEHPRLIPRMFPLHPLEFTGELLRGDLDVAIVSVSVDHPGLVATPLSGMAHGIYCGRHHELFGREGVTWAELEGRHFAAPIPDDVGQYQDEWPAQRRREVVMEFAEMSVGFRACRDGKLLAVLPDDVAIDEQGLWRLRALSSSSHAFAIYRTTMREPGPVESLVDEIQAMLDARHTDDDQGEQ